MVILDTDILVDILRGNETIREKINQLTIRGNVKTTSISAYEVFEGAYLHAKNEEKIAFAKGLLSSLEICDFDILSSEKAAEIFVRLQKQGNKLDLMDIMIAAIAITKNETLITNNIKHFERIKELRLEKI